MYTADRFLEFDAADVMAIEERQVSLLFRGRYWATYVTLKNGAEYSLNGQLRQEIEAARRQSQEVPR